MLSSSTSKALPALVNREDLAGDSLLSLQQKQFIKTWFKEHPTENSCNALKNKNNELNDDQSPLKSQFSVLFNRDNQSYWVKYYGEKKNKQLGSGGEGVVKLAQNMESNEWLAIKARKKSNLQNQLFSQSLYFNNEKRIGDLLKLNFQTIETVNSFFLIQPLVLGDELYILTTGKVTLTTKQKLSLILALLNEVKKLSDLDIIHRDLKLENIMFDLATITLRLIDFANAITKPELTKTDKFTIAIMGTPGYLHKDALPTNTSYPIYSEKTDLYATLICIAFITGCAKFIDSNESPLLDTVELEESRCDKFVKDNIFPTLEEHLPNKPLEKIPTIDKLIEKFHEINSLYDIEHRPAKKLKN